MSNSSQSSFQMAIVLFVAVISGAFSSYLTTESILAKQPKIKVVDVKALTAAQILHIEEKFKDAGGVINPETISLFGQKAAVDMFKSIAVEGKEDFILTKSQVVHSPTGSEITEKVGQRLGLDLTNVSLADAVNEFNSRVEAE